MKKSGLLMAFLLLATLASAQKSYTFGIADVGGTLYCNYEQFTVSNGLVYGVDNLSPCGLSINATIAGFQSSVKPNRAVANGAGVVYGDAIYQAFGYSYNIMWTVFSKLKCNKQDKSGRYIGPLSWAGNTAISGVELGVNYSYLTCDIPGKNGVVPTRGPTAFPAKK